jgi:hypothetical protein
MFTRGAAAVALVNALEANSYRCELWMVSLAQGRSGIGGVKVRIKKADEPADLDALAFWMSITTAMPRFRLTPRC